MTKVKSHLDTIEKLIADGDMRSDANALNAAADKAADLAADYALGDTTAVKRQI